MFLLCCFKALLAAKLFSKMACVLARMDRTVFPSLADVSKALDKQVSETSSLWPLLVSRFLIQPPETVLCTQGIYVMLVLLTDFYLYVLFT